MNLPFLILATLTVLNSGQSCLSSADDFAAENVVSNYNLDNLLEISERNSGFYYMESQYSPELITLIKKTSFPEGLSIRLQIPTEIVEISQPDIKIVSTSAEKTLRKNLPSSFNGWKISCDSLSCEFNKNDLVVFVRGEEQPETTIEIKKDLKTCDSSCNGLCFSAKTEAKCIDLATKSEIESIIKYSNVSNNFEELLSSYRIVGTEKTIFSDLQPSENPLINWQEAMRQELVYLESEGIVNLERDEIESITSATRRGQAGQNYRIVLDPADSKWKSYNKLNNSVLTEQKDCNSYQIKENSLENPKPIDIFYLVPIIITSASLILLLILIVIARIINLRNKRISKKKSKSDSQLTPEE